MTHICERCTAEFFPRDKKKGHRYCSRRCANVRRIKLTPENLRPFAELGMRIKVIAHELGVAYASVRRAMRRYGLHRTWALNRFKNVQRETALPLELGLLVVVPARGWMVPSLDGTALDDSYEGFT